MPIWTDPGRCSTCKFCSMDMDMDPFCVHPSVKAQHRFGLSLRPAIKEFCGEDLKLRVPRQSEEKPIQTSGTLPECMMPDGAEPCKAFLELQDKYDRAMKLVEIDLKKGDGHEHPDFNTKDYFLALVDQMYLFGRFEKVWFGWHFSCRWGASGGMQFDTPGTNSSRWKKVWRIEGLK